MSPEKWKQVEEVFSAALDVPEDEREAFVSHTCAGNPDLKAEVESLLRHDRLDSISLAQGVEEVASWAVSSDNFLGKHIGPYQITETLGCGGMGAVYLAVRVDEEYSKRVAIKVVKRGMDTDAVLERFRHERQILANLDHPYIARLLDGGTTETGQPYFVMEYVEGQEIAGYCVQLNLALEERIGLFLKVCEAVSHAHRNLVIHRDLKPDNILVTADRTPKLLDFGIAKLFSAEPGPGTVALTSTLARRITPDFASPEEVSGRKVTTAADIYSLGAVLFRLLTGAGPHRIDTYTPLEVERAVCEKETEKPSIAAMRNAGAKAWSRKLGGDLDNIVLMAMRKDPGRRYASVPEFADDLRRFLDGRAVSARAYSTTERMLMFAGRHRAGVAAAALITVTVFAGAGATTWQAIRAERRAREALAARQDAEASKRVAERQTAEAGRQRQVADAARLLAERRFTEGRRLANQLFREFYDGVIQLPGSTELRRTSVLTAINYLDRLSKEAGGDRDTSADLAEAYQRMGDVQGNPLVANLGDQAGALESYGKAERIWLDLASAAPLTRPMELALAVNHSSLGQLLTSMGQREGSKSHHEQSIAILKKLMAAEPGNTQFRLQAARAYAGHALTQVSIDDLPGALRSAHIGESLFHGLQAQSPDDPLLLDGQASCLATIGRVLVRQNSLQAALEPFQTALDIRKTLIARQPNNAGFQRSLMLAYSHIGDLLGNPSGSSLRRPEEANQAYQEMARIAHTLSAADPTNRLSEMDVAFAEGRSAGPLLTLGRYKEAIPHLRESVRVLERLTASAPRNLPYVQNLAFFHRRLGDCLVAIKEEDQAVREFRRAFTVAQTVVAIDSRDLTGHNVMVDSYIALAPLLLRKGDSAALETAQRAMTEAEKFREVVPASFHSALRVPRAAAVLAATHQALAANVGLPWDVRKEHARKAKAFWDKAASNWAQMQPADLARSNPGEKDQMELDANAASKLLAALQAPEKP